jgi:protein-tyrosine phosphatase
MKPVVLIALAALLLGCTIGCGATCGGGATLNKRPQQWAEPYLLAGVCNLYQVSPNLYRSAQPTAGGMVNLKANKIKTVVSLRSFHSDRDEIGNTGLKYEHIYMKAWHPEEEDIIKFLQIVTDKDKIPVLVHCQHGSDRTGTMCALYRIIVQGWPKTKAIDEMRCGGFGFHKIWDDLATWINSLNLEEIKTKAGLSDPLYTGPEPASICR